MEGSLFFHLNRHVQKKRDLCCPLSLKSYWGGGVSFPPHQWAPKKWNLGCPLSLKNHWGERVSLPSHQWQCKKRDLGCPPSLKSYWGGGVSLPPHQWPYISDHRNEQIWVEIIMTHNPLQYPLADYPATTLDDLPKSSLDCVKWFQARDIIPKCCGDCGTVLGFRTVMTHKFYWDIISL